MWSWVICVQTPSRSRYAGVPDVHQAEALTRPEQGGERGAHALQLGVLLDHDAQLVVGLLHGGAERGQEIGSRHVVVERDERGDHLGAGDLTWPPMPSAMARSRGPA
ncbi:hypothetical protein SBADM41S_03679 [Streptomyces badius]